mgnify:CR=1 FL=1
MTEPGGLKFLIAGLGSIGQRHLMNLRELGQEQITLFRTGRSTLADPNLPFPVFYDLAEALAGQPDAVIIANPTSLHMPVAEMAAASGAHIFLEKPISHTMDSLQNFEEVLKGSASRVFVAYQFRFNAGLCLVKKLLDDQDLGKPLSFQSRWGEYLPDWHPWEDYRHSYAARVDMGGGVVLTLSHPIDYLRWFFGDVASLSAEVGNRSDLELACEDYADAQLVFHSGVSGQLHLDYYAKPKVHDLSIQCDHGSIQWDYLSNAVQIGHRNGETELILPPADYERNSMYLDEMAHFIAVCKGESEPLCTYQDGRQSLQVALGILQGGRYHDQVVFEK